LREIAAPAGHTSVVTVLDRYGYVLPGTEAPVNDAPDAVSLGARDRRAMNGPGREAATSPEVADQDFLVGDRGLEPRTSAV
jgi:hypothetical protein